MEALGRRPGLSPVFADDASVCALGWAIASQLFGEPSPWLEARSKQRSLLAVFLHRRKACGSSARSDDEPEGPTAESSQPKANLAQGRRAGARAGAESARRPARRVCDRLGGRIASPTAERASNVKDNRDLLQATSAFRGIVLQNSATARVGSLWGSVRAWCCACSAAVSGGIGGRYTIFDAS